jgi:hypothetical protein
MEVIFSGRICDEDLTLAIEEEDQKRTEDVCNAADIWNLLSD